MSYIRFKSVLLSFLLVFSSPGVQLAAAELISTGVAFGSALAASSFFAGYEYFKCKWYECCDKQWITGNHTGLRLALKERLYGQHLVIDTVVRAIKAHFQNENPKKALVMSFHGWTGGGKNYVSNIIAEYLYKRAMKSNNVHFFVGGLHFPHPQESATYKSQLHNWIRGNVTRCPRSIFIFDELDKVEPGVLDAIKPFIDFYEELNGVDFRKSIFLFLSNTGGNDITKSTLDHWQNGYSRESLKLKDMEEIINLAAFNEEGGLRFSNLIDHHLIDHFIPFLPLEREHVKLCIRDYLIWKKVEVTEERILKIADMLDYIPKGNGVFSSTGCKRVAHKAELLLQEQEEEEEEKNEQYSHTEL